MKGDFMHFLYHIVFIVITVFILFRTISYGLFEIKSQNNKSGGICVICFSVLVVIFANIMVFLR